MEEDAVEEYAGLRDWLELHGAIINNIEPATFPETGRGVRATGHIEPGDELLCVPEVLLLTGRSARRDPVLAAALLQLEQRHGTKSSPVEELAAHLLVEMSKGAGSFWAPYLRHLPRNYTTPACFPRDEACEQLQAEYAVDVAYAARRSAQESYCRVQPMLHALGLSSGYWGSAQAWAWALAGLSSRTMHLSPDEPAGGLTPLGDLHNYQAPPPPYVPSIPGLQGCTVLGNNSSVAAGLAAAANSSYLQHGAVSSEEAEPSQQELVEKDKDEEDGSSCICGDGKFDEAARVYRLSARQRYLPGDQVFLCYGAHTNLELLEHYGFVLPAAHNPHDLAVLPPGSLPPGVAAALPGQADRAVHSNGLPTWNLLKELRLAALNKVERKASGYLAACGERVSAANDAAALGLLHAACRATLRTLPTTLEEDEVLLGTLWRQRQQQQHGTAGSVGTRRNGGGEGAAVRVRWGGCYSEGGGGIRHGEPPSDDEVQALVLEWRVEYKRALHASLRLQLINKVGK